MGVSRFHLTLVHFRGVKPTIWFQCWCKDHARPLWHSWSWNVPKLEAGFYRFFLKSPQNCEADCGTRWMRSGHKGHCSRGLHHAPRDHVLYSLSISLGCGSFRISSSVSSLQSDDLLLMLTFAARTHSFRNTDIPYIYIYIYIYLTTAIWLTPGGSVVVRTISIHRTTQTITEQIQITATQ